MDHGIRHQLRHHQGGIRDDVVAPDVGAQLPNGAPCGAGGVPLRGELVGAALLVSSIADDEVVTVLADNYSTPDDVVFEKDVKVGVNRQLQRLAVVSVCRLDSKAADPVQVADLLTGAVTFEFRAAEGLAKVTSPKGKVARHVRDAFGVDTFLEGVTGGRMSADLFGSASVTDLVARPTDQIGHPSGARDGVDNGPADGKDLAVG